MAARYRLRVQVDALALAPEAPGWTILATTVGPAVAARHRAVPQQVPEGARGQGLSLLSEHGWQPTSLACMGACRTLEIQPACPRANTPQGNADTERVIRTLKEECLWLQEWTCPFAGAGALETGIDAYNAHSLHSALGDKPPRQCERDAYASPSSPFVAA